MKKKRNNVFEYLDKNDENFNKEDFEKLTYSKEGFDSLKNDYNEYQYNRDIRERMLINLRECDETLLNHIIFYTEYNGPRDLENRYLSIIPIIFALLGFFLEDIFEIIKENNILIFIILLLTPAVLYYFLSSIYKAGKTSTYSYLNNLCKQVLSEKSSSHNILDKSININL